jgi:hypothetical protein
MHRYLEENDSNTKWEDAAHHQDSKALSSLFDVSTATGVEVASFGIPSECWSWKSVQLELI